ncbi:MAG: acetyl-CoA carboxylase biotin carboxyl carrier protein subunit [Desulfobacterium sp.]|nr:acetyl-CoA carboxylase biotin carboxyl carrier protein subunit [Desulfobacterium sp.]
MSKDVLLSAPMMGKVIQIDVNPGDRVEEEDEAIVIEAMKMETPIYIPCDGTISKVNVKVGDTVEEDDLLLSIAPE